MKKTVTLAFQHTLKKKSSLRSIIETKLIQWWTGSNYFHVEMILDGKWISSGPTHGGVYIKELKPLNYELYDYINVEVTVSPERLEKIIDFVEENQGTGYDWAGIWFSQTFKSFNADDKTKWFCSELVAELLKRLGYPLKKLPNQYSPSELFHLVTRYRKD